MTESVANFFRGVPLVFPFSQYAFTEAEIDSSAGAPVKTSEEDEDHAEEHAQIESQLQPPQDAASVRNHASSVTSSHLAGDGFEEQQDTSVVTSTDEEVLDGGNSQLIPSLGVVGRNYGTRTDSAITGRAIALKSQN